MERDSSLSLVSPAGAFVARLDRAAHVYPRGDHGLRDVSLTVRAGDLVYICGESGAGKTTLLKLLYGALRATSGEVWVDGVALHSASKHALARTRRRIGFVLQDYGLLPQLTAIENVCFAVQVTNVWMPFGEVTRRAQAALEAVGLGERVCAYPRQLSGGQQQRLAIARALVNQPRLLLADEPTGNLDAGNARRILELLEEIAARGTAVVVATHDASILKPERRTVTLAGGTLIAAGERERTACG